MLCKSFIPYRGYYSTAFCRWQGSMANENSIKLVAKTSERWLNTNNLSPSLFDYVIFGNTISQLHQFYSAPWASAMLGCNVPGISISQACTTGATCIFNAAINIETGLCKNVFVLTTDRTSNGPHTIWPNPKGPGGEVISENWLMDNFNSDPNVGLKMVETAENVAKKIGITKIQCDDLTLRRFEQYQMSLANNREFQQRYMFGTKISLSKNKSFFVEQDEGILKTTSDGLTSLKPLIPGGVITFGTQTHPADGNASVIVTTKELANDLSYDKNISIRVISYGYARVDKGLMAEAPVPATLMALENSNLKIKDIKVIKTHNP